MTVLCAGDAFITADALAAQVHAQLADLGELTVLTIASDWPDEAFGDVDGVREAAGDPDEFARLAAEADVIVTHLAPVTARVIQGAGRLRIIGSVRGGPVNIDIAAATAAGVPVAYLPGRNLTAAAEFTVGMMIAVTRNIGPGSHQLIDGTWNGSYYRYELAGPELGHATVGLVGFGAIGAHVTRLLRAFGSTVLVCDPYADPARIIAEGAQPVELDDLLGRCDIVSLHPRLTPQTSGMADAAFFGKLRPGAFFVNTARGELVVTDDLVAALQSGQVAGAALDVFDPEPPPPGSPLLAHPRVVATPHLAGASRRVADFSAEAVVAAVGTYLRDGTLQHCANPEVLSG
ncbi:2-hydroxyacid dehydrogenase [Nakamurella flavida]|uniref:2-hydroxyacid dehydrogenase n=1 Tax=Nakamurella flavida TaxID=363630 RepID=A0A938YPD5_9ACTN|nr:2-hydroxyacid dehydrogenase [Nakamurella flavida]